LLKHFELDSLEIRRFKTDLILFQKIIHGYININHNNIFQFKQTSTRNDKYKIQIPAVQNQIRHNTFFITVPRQYSSLPLQIRKSELNSE
jgi:hypothetical protein